MAGRGGFIGFEIADTYAKEAVRERTPDMAIKKEMKRINLFSSRGEQPGRLVGMEKSHL